MKRTRLFVIFSILTAIFLFGTAAICNQCSTGTQTTEGDVSDEQSVDLTGSDQSAEEEAAVDDTEEAGDPEGEADTGVEEENSLPVIESVTADGRDVTDETEMYAFVGRSLDFRVQASDPDGDVLGFEIWEVERAHIDSEEQIDNIYEFVLTPDSAGEGSLGVSVSDIEYDSDSWTITLNIGTEEGGSGGYVYDDIIVAPDPALSGSVDEDEGVRLASASSGAPDIYVGDTPSGGTTKGFLSFDLGELTGKNIDEAELVISSLTRLNDPSSLLGSNLDFFAVNYGTSLDRSDYTTGTYTYLAGMSPGRTSYTISGNVLRDAIQEVLDDPGRDNFQVKLFFENANTNGDADGFAIYMSDVQLNITYYPA